MTGRCGYIPNIFLVYTNYSVVYMLCGRSKDEDGVFSRSTLAGRVAAATGGAGAAHPGGDDQNPAGEDEEVNFDHAQQLHENNLELWAALDIARSLREIRVILTPRLSARLTVTRKGDHHMPASIPVGKTGTAQWQEFSGPNGTGDKLPPAGPVTFSSDNTSVATVDPSSGLVTAMAAGTCNISGSDSANSLTASDSVTVTAAVAQSATLTVVPN
jgi:hypothetical protein